MPITWVFVENSFIYANSVVLLALGLTLTYLTTKVPNFAHGSIAVVGAYALFTVVVALKMSPVLGFALAFASGSLTAVAQYLLVLRPLQKRGASALSLMIATLGIDVLLMGLLNIYADHVRTTYHLVTSRDWSLRSLVLERVAGLTVGTWISTGLVLATLVSMYLLLTRTKFGVAMRASIENPHLAQVLGVNVDLVYGVSWALAGGLAGLAGGLLSFVLRVNPATGSLEVLTVFAASIVGGLQSLVGAVVGGYFVGLAETLGTRLLGELLGAPWLMSFRKAVSLSLLVASLLFFPQGLVSAAPRFSKLRLGVARRIKQIKPAKVVREVRA